jgi:hypothetical protein
MFIHFSEACMQSPLQRAGETFAKRTDRGPRGIAMDGDCGYGCCKFL